jgi:trehalose-6-phosphate hydrolase
MSFKNKVIYQIYPKSFKDTTGNGVGDLQGIIEKLPYLAELGISMVWLNPIYPSPQKDNGYDISDYIAIDPLFGTMADFDQLVAEAKKYQIELMLDMVLNHVSTEHVWFKKALAGEQRYQDYFILRDSPTDWGSKFGGNAWAPFGDTGRYFLHLYDKTQADLNWHNPEVRANLQEVVKFWMNKGVSGFRFDVINVIGKEVVLKDNPVNEGKAEYTDKPITHTFLKELNAKTYGQNPASITVGEMSSTTVQNCVLYTNPAEHELSMTFNFHHLKVDYLNGKKWTKTPFDFNQLTSLFHEWGEGMSAGNGWNAWFFNNHDQPRALNRFVNVAKYREKGAQMLASVVHLNRGTPFVYMGEEIGMLDPDYTSMAAYRDIESLNAYQELLAAGQTPAVAFSIIQTKSRDNSRTPMQWDNRLNAGFSTGNPWLAVGNHPEINVANEQNGAVLNYYKRLIQLRKEYPIIAEGTYRAYLPDHAQVYSFIREWQGQKLLVLNNFYDSPTNVELPAEFLTGEVLLSNDVRIKLSATYTLSPYQTLAILI